MKKIQKPGTDEFLPLLQSKDPLRGIVKLVPPENKSIDHNGITCELFGRVEVMGEKSEQNNFVSVSKELEEKGTLSETSTYKFDFSLAKKEFESYYGTHVKLYYVIVVTINRSGPLSVHEEKEFYVVNLEEEPDINLPIRMEVGVKGQMHIEFEYSKSYYHLDDSIFGRILFLNTKLKIKNMEIAIIKKETGFTDNDASRETETILNFEVMDGAPVKGEVIPIRIHLKPLKLSPTFSKMGNVFQLKYFLKVVIFDEEDRRYFKQQEVFFYRKVLPV